MYLGRDLGTSGVVLTVNDRWTTQAETSDHMIYPDPNLTLSYQKKQ